MLFPMHHHNADYYSNSYAVIQRTGFQGWGNSLIDRLIEKRVNRKEGMRILELGASSGEHLKYVKTFPLWSKYICLDLNPGISDPVLFRVLTKRNPPPIQNISFVKARAEQLPFADKSFDLIILTCLLAHVRDVEQVLSEMRRVVTVGGQIVIGLPTDPGIINRLVKLLITYPKMKRTGVLNPRLTYAREHINPIGNLIALIKNAFSSDEVKLHFFPLRLQSWNFNLVVIVNCSIRK
jgi:ubiquinone/menaquinone biosynthesis C-methylase UbiE